MMEFQNKKVLVYGGGKSGTAAFELLEGIGAKPFIFDDRKDSLPGDLSGIDLAVMSPGVPCDTPSALALKEAGVPVIGEIELAWQTGKGTLFAVTGTNGKTTTTTLLGEIMKAFSSSVFVVGNIGTAYTSVASETRDDSYVVAEISSFQLETAVEFHPHISAILNITPDHLNRHHTMEIYTAVKESIKIGRAHV